MQQSTQHEDGEFYSTEHKKNMTIQQYNESLKPQTGAVMSISKYTIIDIDKDGISEFVLQEKFDDNDYLCFLILHAQTGKIYGYTMWYRAFMNLKSDGTFSFSGGALDHGFGTMKLTDKDTVTDRITYSESSYNANNEIHVSYFVDHKSATSSDFDAAMDAQGKKQDPTWITYTQDSQKEIFSTLGKQG